MYQYPYGDSQQLNLDWIINKLTELEKSFAGKSAELEEFANALISLTYIPTKAYNNSDIVFHDGHLYRCNTTIPAPGEVWNPAHWDQIMLGNTVANLVRAVAGMNSDHVFNESNVPGTHVTEALNALVEDIRYDNHKVQQKKNGAYTDVIPVEDTPSNNSDRLASSKAAYDLKGAINVETWKGKHVLIIGDSWAMGWTGSEYVENKYPEIICNLLGCTADVCRQGSGGFTAQGSAAATYPNETFVDVLEHYKTNKYDAIIVQSGWNDIHNDNATDSTLSTAIYNFMVKVRQDFNNITVFCIPSYPAYLMPLARYDRAKTLVNQSQYQGMVTSITSLNWLMHGRNSFRGSDTAHPNQSGYSFFARLVASFLSGTKTVEWIQDQMTYQRENGTVSNNTTPFDLTFPDSEAFNTGTAAIYIKFKGDTVALNLRTRVLTQDTSGNKIFIQGLPAPALDYQYLTVSFNSSGAIINKVLPRAYVDYNTGTVQVVLTGDAYNSIIEIRGVYKTKQNMYL